MISLRSLESHADINDIVHVLKEDGCVIIKNLLSTSDLENLKAELDDKLAQIPNCSGDFYGYATKRMSGLIEKSPASRDIAIHPTILDVMDKFLLQGCREYQLNLTQAIRIGPGEPAQMLHRDDLMFPFEHLQYEAMINCMWSIDEFTAENGGTHLVPGSHKWVRGRKAEAHEVVRSRMPAGSVLIYLGSLIHAGGANETDKSRTGLVISYSQGWLRQAENQYLAISQKTAATLPERLQRLVGYFVHKPNLGCVDGQDPLLLLQDGYIDEIFTEFIPDEAKPIIKSHRDSSIAKTLIMNQDC